MRYTLYKGQKKLWCNLVTFFVIGQNVRKNDDLMHRKVIKIYNFLLFVTQNIPSFGLK